MQQTSIAVLRLDASHLQNRFLSNPDVMLWQGKWDITYRCQICRENRGREMTEELGKLCEWKCPQNGKMKGSG